MIKVIIIIIHRLFINGILLLAKKKKIFDLVPFLLFNREKGKNWIDSNHTCSSNNKILRKIIVSFSLSLTLTFHLSLFITLSLSSGFCLQKKKRKKYLFWINEISSSNKFRKLRTTTTINIDIRMRKRKNWMNESKSRPGEIILLLCYGKQKLFLSQLWNKQNKAKNLFQVQIQCKNNKTQKQIFYVSMSIIIVIWIVFILHRL